MKQVEHERVKSAKLCGSVLRRCKRSMGSVDGETFSMHYSANPGGYPDDEY